MKNLAGTLYRHKHIIVLSIATITIALYIVPIDHIFSAPGAEAQQGGSGNKYGGHFGPAPGHGGQNPAGPGGHPPGNTPGGSNTPPGHQQGGQGGIRHQ
jgi:hypothetical protein